MSEGQDYLIVDIDGMLTQLPSYAHSTPKIYKVDDSLRGVNGKAFDPELVAIGPIHHGKVHVKEMELQKKRFVNQLLQRRKEGSVKKYVMQLRESKEEALKCYSNPIEMKEDEFVQILLLDGLFVIELVRKYHFGSLRDTNDTLFQYDHALDQLRHDLLLLENQLPFFILKLLFNMTKTEDPEDDLHYLIHLFLHDMIPWQLGSKSRPHNLIALVDDHLLGMVYRTHFSFVPLDSPGKASTIEHSHLQHDSQSGEINSASELKEAGIRLKKGKGISLKEVRFANGVMELPEMNVSDKTESILRNLIAYEQFLSNVYPKYVTDYAFLMHCLVNSAKDVEILRRAGIIRNLLGDDQTAYLMITKLGKNVAMSSDFCYSGIFQSVNEHCGLRHKKWMAKFKRNYCNSPWAFSSIMAAAVLLLLTLIQTVFSVLDYTKKSQF